MRLRRVGKWVEAVIAGDPGNKPARVIPSAPELPEELQRFDHENTPHLAIRNARSAFSREDWKTLVEQFTPLARFDTWAGLNNSLTADVTEVKKAAVERLFQTEPDHPWLAEIWSQADSQIKIIGPGGTATTSGEQFRSRAVESALSLSGTLLSSPGYGQRVADIRPQVQSFQKGTTEYLLLHTMLLNRALGKPALLIFEGDNVEVNIDQQEGNSARGELRIGVASTIPISFRLVENNWKIDGILTPETSALMLDPEPTPTSDAAAEPTTTPAPIAEEQPTGPVTEPAAAGTEKRE